MTTFRQQSRRPLAEDKLVNVSLTPELERFIADLVDGGRFRSASEAVRAGIRLLQEREEEREARLEALRKGVGEALEELEGGEGIPADKVFGEILEALRRTEVA
jgi:antitoxin ParD1/3/4